MNFPNYFPENFEVEILPKDAEYDSLEVFRILIDGRLDARAFESIYKGVTEASCGPHQITKKKGILQLQILMLTGGYIKM